MKRYFERYDKEKNRYEQLVEECTRERRKEFLEQGWTELTDLNETELKVMYGRKKGKVSEVWKTCITKICGKSRETPFVLPRLFRRNGEMPRMWRL